MTQQTVWVSVRNVYGNEMIYPANETASKFAQLTGKKTFSLADLRTIRELGYTVEPVLNTLAA
jgi:hypothetical protein